MLRDHIEFVQVWIERLLCFGGWDFAAGFKDAAMVEPVDLLEIRNTPNGLSVLDPRSI